MRGAYIVTDKIYVGRGLFLVVVACALYKFDSRTRAEIRSAYADDDENITCFYDLFSRFLYAGNLVAVIVFGEIAPAEKVRSRALSAENRVESTFRFVRHSREGKIRHELTEIFVCEIECHFMYLSNLFLCKRARPHDYIVICSPVGFSSPPAECFPQ